MKKLLFLAILGTSLPSFAYEGNGRNPGDWKMMPTALIADDLGYRLKIRNLDLFNKACTVRVQYKGQNLTRSGPIIFRAARSQEITLVDPASLTGFAPPTTPLELRNLDINLSCVKVSDEETLSALTGLKELTCTAQHRSCQQICLATTNEAEACVNNHLSVNFIRSSWAPVENELSWMGEGTFVQTGNKDLDCRFIITAKAIGSSGDTSFITAPSRVVRLSPNLATKVSWTFHKTEAGEGRTLDLTRPRVAGVCSPVGYPLPASALTVCDPLKRPECNWVVPIDSLEGKPYAINP